MTRLASLRRRPQGFTLIEVMIAVLVLATGFLALTALQGALIRSSADSKARSQIVTYAAGEMDRIRTGTAVANATGTAANCDDTTGLPAIDCAAKAAGVSTLNQVATPVTYYADASGNFDPANPDTGENAWFRRITLNMGWTDATGGSRNLSVTTDVSPLTLTASKVLVDREPSDDTGLRPIVRRLSPVTEGMIPIATGQGDEATAATNPKPKLLGGDTGTYVSDTRFDVLTYSALQAPPDFVRFNKKIETAVVGCTCQKGTNGFTGNGPAAYVSTFLAARAYRPAYWDGRTYKTPAAALGPVDSSPADVSQSVLCDVCCRDHKDPGTEPGPKFSPWPGQDPLHYSLDADGAWVEATGGTDQYLEACRIIRVDGVFRVAADPKIQDNAFVPTREYVATATSGSLHASVSNTNAATSSLLDAEGKPLYEAYVYDAVSAGYFSTTAVANVGNAVNYSTIQQSTNLNNPTYVPILPTNDRRWLHSRVFMMDFLEADARTRLRDASTECENPSTSVLKAQCVLPYLPLASINTTEVASWSPRAATVSDVAPAPVDTLDSNHRNYATAKVRRFNSGLALFSAINLAEATTIVPAIDEQLIVQLSAAPPAQALWLDTPSPNPSSARFFGDVLNPMRGYAQTSAPIPFRLSWSFPTGNPGSPTADSNKGNDPAATVTGSGGCTPNSAGGTSNPYVCSTSSTTGVEITIAGYNRIEVDTNVNNPCPGGSGKVSKPSCVVYTFTGASVDSPASSVSTSTLVSGTAGKLNEVRKFTVSAVNATPASTVTVDFTRSTPATTNTCSGTTPVWIVPCQ